MVMFRLAPIISFAVFLFHSCMSQFLSLSMVHVFLSFLVYFPTFTSFFPLSPWNLIGLSPLLWRLRIRLSTSQASSTSGNVEKEGNDKKEGAIGDWGWGPPVTQSRSMCYNLPQNLVFKLRKRYINQDETGFLLPLPTTIYTITDLVPSSLYYVIILSWNKANSLHYPPSRIVSSRYRHMFSQVIEW